MVCDLALSSSLNLVYLIRIPEPAYSSLRHIGFRYVYPSARPRTERQDVAMGLLYHFVRNVTPGKGNTLNQLAS